MNFVDFDLYHNKCGVYMIKCLGNNKVYIGATVRASFQKRYTAHKNRLINHSHRANIQYDYDIFGNNGFEFSVLFVSDNPIEIAQQEQQYINHYQTLGLCYNYDTIHRYTDTITHDNSVPSCATAEG